MDPVFWIQLIHTLVFLFVSACILYVVYGGIVGRLDRRLWAAAGIVLLVGLTYAVNGFECPLATLVHHVAGRRDVADILFPNWFARNIMPVSTGIFVVGLVLVSVRGAQRNWGPRSRRSRRTPGSSNTDWPARSTCDPRGSLRAIRRERRLRVPRHRRCSVECPVGDGQAAPLQRSPCQITIGT